MEPECLARIATLVPAATEAVCCLGLQSRLVARSHECNHPLEIEHLPVCTETVLDAGESSARIDQEVKQALNSGLPLYRVLPEVLLSTRPTHIVTQDQCQVCAVDLERVQDCLPLLEDPPPQIVTLGAQRLPDLWSDLQQLARVFQIESHAGLQIKGLQDRLAAIADRRPAGVTPRVACIEWLDPLMISGNWVPELVEHAGGTVISGQSGVPSQWMTWDALLDAAPEVVIVAPCGFNIQRTRGEWELLTSRPEWSRLPAVVEGRVYLMDGDHYLNRPGPRLVDSVEILAEILHPERFMAAHRGLAWIPA